MSSSCPIQGPDDRAPGGPGTELFPVTNDFISVPNGPGQVQLSSYFMFYMDFFFPPTLSWNGQE